jgi:tetratricopeptide (TPR) repeat protein
MEFAEGKVKAAQATLAKAVANYRKQGLTEQANRLLQSELRIEADLGLPDSAHALLIRLPEITDSVDIPVAWAAIGETTRAANLLQNQLDAHPTATLWRQVWAPQITAAIALNQHRPADAIQALQAALPYDLRDFAVPALRGGAYLADKQPALAEIEFHKILEHPGIDPLSHNYPLARLGLARALVRQGKLVDAGFAYKIVMQIWAEADLDLPPFKAAKAEYAKLTAVPVKQASASVKPRRK